MESCPACERKFEKFGDYPVIRIERFSRIEMPELITGFPTHHYAKRTILGRKKIKPPIQKKVLKLFDEGMKEVIYQGRVYNRTYKRAILFLEDEGSVVYTSAKDVTNFVKEALNSSRIKNSLSELENLVGKDIRTSDLVGLFKSVIEVGDYGKVSLSISQHSLVKEEKSVNNDSRKCQIFLWRSLTSEDCYPYDDADFNTSVAEFFYKGKINKPEQSRKI